MIIADENLEQYWIELLRDKRFEVFSIRDEKPGISDREIAEFVRSRNGCLITEDKDFGELIFSYGVKSLSVILLRYDQPRYSQIEPVLLKFLSDYVTPAENLFVTVTPGRVRVRSI
ncbi:MAG: DUF5615 family PIN-like protein [Chitinophagales bacterium]|nr:DUF5615 family PIN-like protein [Chitinophagales bacterium]